MLITLVALLCNGALCVEKKIIDSDQSDITLISCQMQGQVGIAQWMANNPSYRDWRVQGYRCISGTYIPKFEL